MNLQVKKSFDKEVFGYVGSVVIILLIVGVIVFLSFNKIPEDNNDVVKMIIGALVVSLGAAVSTMIGRNPEEVNEIKRDNSKLKEENSQLKQRVADLENRLSQLQHTIIERLAGLTIDSSSLKDDN